MSKSESQMAFDGVAEKKPTRLIIDPAPNPGSWNMALDEALLLSAINDRVRTVRIYRWSEPTVSLGYFQQADEIDADSPLAGLAKVKRLSGGGAILHHHEWTYSCCVPAGDESIRVPGELYHAVHRAITGVLGEYNVHASMRSEATQASIGRQPADNAATFLCFSRGDPNDIVLEGIKIVGSAQRRRKGAVLQHGSLLLKASQHAPQLPGVVDLLPGFVADERLGEQLGRAIAGVFNASFELGEPSIKESESATRLQREHYSKV